MEAEQRIQALEQEVQILKTQIQAILLDIQTHLLTNTYPALRDHHTASSSSSEDEDDDDEYDRAAPAPKVRKVSLNSAAPKQQKVVSPAVPAEPVMASLDEQQEWVLQNIQSLGINRTRELINSYTEARRFSPEVSDTLMRFTHMYAAAADEPTLPSRPAGMPTSKVAVKQVAVPPKQAVKAQLPQQPVEFTPAPQPVKPAPKMATKPTTSASVKPATTQPANDPVEPPKAEAVEPSSLVLRLIAGVQNAGAGVRWGKNKN